MFSSSIVLGGSLVYPSRCIADDSQRFVIHSRSNLYLLQPFLPGLVNTALQYLGNLDDSGRLLPLCHVSFRFFE